MSPRTKSLTVVACVLMLAISAMAAPVNPSSNAEVKLNLPGYQYLDAPPFKITLANSESLINLDDARTAFPSVTGSGYTVAVIDTGVDYTHPALAGRYLGGYDFVNGDTNPMDDHGHGTHVAGIATSNNGTYTGLAPQANYVALKVLDAGGSGTWGNVESALQWVIANRAAYNIVAVNMSFGTSTAYQTPVTSALISDEFAALKAAGVFVASSAGNEYVNIDEFGGGIGYPAADPSVVSVGSVWSANFGGVAWTSGAIDYTTGPDRLVSHSNRYPGLLDLLAPGALITSTDLGGGFVSRGGTSMASPMVAGLSMLLREAIEENWDSGTWPTGAGWQDLLLSIMQSTAVQVYDGDDEDDNVTNLNMLFPRIDVLAALGNIIPEPSCLLLMVSGVGLLMFHRRHVKMG